jgi:hypothetical protein
MLDINGVGTVKMARFGEMFIDEIQRFSNEFPGKITQIQPNTGSVHAKSRGDFLSQHYRVSETVNETKRYIDQGFDIQQIAEIRSLSQSTIVKHVESLIIQGVEIDINKFVSESVCREAEELFIRLGTLLVGEVVRASEGRISYDHAGLIRAELIRKRKIVATLTN